MGSKFPKKASGNINEAFDLLNILIEERNFYLVKKCTHPFIKFAKEENRCLVTYPL